MSRRLLVTSALPYANGHIHIGHLVEYIQTDVWVRFQKLIGNDCRYMCADDTHGTAIMIRARQEGRSEEALIADMQAAHERDFADFGIEFDNYGSTHSEENRALCHEIWAAIRKAGLVKEQAVEQLFDPQAGTFLADRFVRGTCPKCKSADQPGDNCSVCGHHYTPVDLIDPVSTLTGAKPEVRSALHLFIELEKLHGFLAEWTQSGDHLQPEIANYLQGHFLGEPLRDWDISRPAPYFGFEIPDSPGNYWYVWFDAPIGYIASTWQWCKRNGQKLDDWWKSDKCEVHHFIGKDITYFHTLFWPGMLKTAGFSLPAKVHIHGFLTVDGEKMSKSKGTFVRARTYLNHLDPSYLRYFYATKLSSRVDDLDMAIDEFIAKVNTDLVGKVVNLASRTARLLASSSLTEMPDILFEYRPDGSSQFDTTEFHDNSSQKSEIAALYENREFAEAMRRIMRMADSANQLVDRCAPWKLARGPERDAVCTVVLNLFRQIVIYLSPVLPGLRQKADQLFGVPIKCWDDVDTPIENRQIKAFQHMLQRVEEKDLLAMIEESKEEAIAQGGLAAEATSPGAGDQWNDSGEALAAEPLAAECSIDDFAKVDLRVARIVSAEEVPEARKLLKLQLSLGGGVTKQVFAGIKAHYEPQQLVGRLVVCVANLAPRTMKFGVSEGMVVAAGGGTEAFLLTPDDGAKPGHRLH
jgi:methionyl-tRNA synthetase